jgi:hypothetical protein
MIVYTFLLPCKNEKDEWRNFLSGPDMIPIWSGIDFYEFGKQENINIGAANLLNILIMSEKSKEMFENSC